MISNIKLIILFAFLFSCSQSAEIKEYEKDPMDFSERYLKTYLSDCPNCNRMYSGHRPAWESNFLSEKHNYSPGWLPDVLFYIVSDYDLLSPPDYFREEGVERSRVNVEFKITHIIYSKHVEQQKILEVKHVSLIKERGRWRVVYDFTKPYANIEGFKKYISLETNPEKKKKLEKFLAEIEKDYKIK